MSFRQLLQNSGAELSTYCNN